MKVLSVVGTRPEAIKMAPVIRRIANEPRLKQVVVSTAQHREMLDQVFELFGILSDHDLNLMAANQTLGGFVGKCFSALDEIFEYEKPDIVLAQGDTSTTYVAAVVSFYRKIPFGHVEAGLRTYDLAQPFPEEFNRTIAGKLASIHFAPTKRARDNLLNEGVPAESVLVTGNTVIDALLDTAGRLGKPNGDGKGMRRILVTAHRRENFGTPIRSICEGVSRLLDRYDDIEVVWPVHPNPSISGVVHQTLGKHARVTLTTPFDYRSFVAELQSAYLVLTDSGGVQEEAPALGKPVLVLREQTERPEAIENGVAALVGTDAERLVTEVSRLLDSKTAYATMAVGSSPYGDGRAAERIVDALVSRYL